MLNKMQRTRLKMLFINTYALMLKGRPYSEYEHYIAVDKVKGVDVGTSYLNRKKAMEFSIAITQCEIRELQALFSKCTFFTLVMDESTDVFRLEQCIAFIRFSIRGEIFTKYLDVNSVVRPNAEQITECILKMMEKNLNWFPPKQEDILRNELFIQDINNQENGDDTIDDEINNDADYESIIVDTEVGCESSSYKQGDDLNDNFEGEDQFNEYEDISNAFEDNRRMEIPEPSAPLLASITTDDANVLKGKRSGVTARLRSTCNNLMLNQKTLAYKNVDVDGINCEWTSLKTISSSWDKNEFPPQNWAEIGKRVYWS